MAMQFFSSPASPFVRKVLVVADETGQLADLDQVRADPRSLDPALVAVNPISKIPALVTAEGVNLAESDMICMYLDERHSGQKMIPASGPARWQALAAEAIADGFMDAAVNRRGEDSRPDGARSQADVDKLMGRMMRCMDMMDAQAKDAGDAVNIGTIAMAVACGYANFRYADLDWRTGRPNLAALYDQMMQRPSMKATQPDG